MLTPTRAVSVIVGRLHLLGVLGEGPLDRETRADGPLRVVLVGDRRAEQGDQPVPGELRHGAVVALHLLRHEADDLIEEELRALRAETLSDRRRAGHVGHENGHDPPLAGGGSGDRHTQSYSGAAFADRSAGNGFVITGDERGSSCS